jgi:hypothetical protein
MRVDTAALAGAGQPLSPAQAARAACHVGQRAAPQHHLLTGRAAVRVRWQDTGRHRPGSRAAQAVLAAAVTAADMTPAAPRSCRDCASRMRPSTRAIRTSVPWERMCQCRHTLLATLNMTQRPRHTISAGTATPTVMTAKAAVRTTRTTARSPAFSQGTATTAATMGRQAMLQQPQCQTSPSPLQATTVLFQLRRLRRCHSSTECRWALTAGQRVSVAGR